MSKFTLGLVGVALFVAGLFIGFVIGVYASMEQALGNVSYENEYNGGTLMISDGELVGPVDSVYDADFSNSTGTTTVQMSGATSCLQMQNTTGTTTRIYLNATTSSLTIEEGSCE